MSLSHCPDHQLIDFQKLARGEGDYHNLLSKDIYTMILRFTSRYFQALVNIIVEELTDMIPDTVFSILESNKILVMLSKNILAHDIQTVQLIEYVDIGKIFISIFLGIPC